MGNNAVSPYQQVIEKTKSLSFRSQMLTMNIEKKMAHSSRNEVTWELRTSVALNENFISKLKLSGWFDIKVDQYRGLTCSVSLYSLVILFQWPYLLLIATSKKNIVKNIAKSCYQQSNFGRNYINGNDNYYIWKIIWQVFAVEDYRFSVFFLTSSFFWC